MKKKKKILETIDKVLPTLDDFEKDISSDMQNRRRRRKASPKKKTWSRKKWNRKET